MTFYCRSRFHIRSEPERPSTGVLMSTLPLGMQTSWKWSTGPFASGSTLRPRDGSRWSTTVSSAHTWMSYRRGTHSLYLRTTGDHHRFASIATRYIHRRGLCCNVQSVDGYITAATCMLGTTGRHTDRSATTLGTTATISFGLQIDRRPYLSVV